MQFVCSLRKVNPEKTFRAMKVSLFDVRIAAVLISLWSIAVVVLITALGLDNSEFFRFGPGESVHFFGSAVNTWPGTARHCFLRCSAGTRANIRTKLDYAVAVESGAEHQSQNVEHGDGVVIGITMTWY